MRLIVAGLVFFGGMIGTVMVLDALFPKGPPVLMSAVVVLSMLTLSALVVMLLNPAGARPVAVKAAAPAIRELEEKGLLVAESAVAAELAAALGVERRITDYPPVPRQ
jgi:formate hydrogenlyase subunit 3/multisubunit Na+/H+ antiporter MnhD subunit